MLTHGYPKTVPLKDGQTVQLRPLARGDYDALHAFFAELPEEDRLFLRHDVRSPDLVRKWVTEPDLTRVTPIVALDGTQIVADGTLHICDHGWMYHVGQIRLVTARSHRHRGLGTVVARELVSLAAERGLEKLQAHVIEDNIGSVKMFERIGFCMAAVLPGLVKDIHGRNRNLAIMINDVSNLGQIIEDWIQDSMIPAYRVPGAGV
jgi:RimJ/RimL family protein N-acetyltransferase